MMYIYKITNLVNGKVYIGKHINYTLNTRELDKNYFCSSDNPHFWNAVRKYEGIGLNMTNKKLKEYCHHNYNKFSKFTNEIIQLCFSSIALNIMESIWIMYYRRVLGWENVYNISGGYLSQPGELEYLKNTDYEKYKLTLHKIGIESYNTRKSNNGGIHPINTKENYDLIRSRNGGKLGLHTAEAISKKHERYLFEKDGIYSVSSKSRPNFKKLGFKRLCPISKLGEYCTENSLDYDNILAIVEESTIKKDKICRCVTNGIINKKLRPNLVEEFLNQNPDYRLGMTIRRS